jgi:ribonuclease BN (tRNA processing enzyme)
MVAEITVLGSGTRVLHRARSMSGYAVMRPDFFVLLDCGGGVIRRALEANCRSCTSTPFFSHLHLDHVAGFTGGCGRSTAKAINARIDHCAFSPPGFGSFFARLAILMENG